MIFPQGKWNTLEREISEFYMDCAAKRVRRESEFLCETNR